MVQPPPLDELTEVELLLELTEVVPPAPPAPPGLLAPVPNSTPLLPQPPPRVAPLAMSPPRTMLSTPRRIVSSLQRSRREARAGPRT
jgi:hypothetical protein